MKKSLYNTLSWTWGIIMTIIGAIAAAGCMALGCKPQKHAGATYFVIGEGWGGVSLGCFFFCSKGANEHTKNHEFGHSLQNCIWGPLFPFVIAIPSAIRYWKFTTNAKKGIPNTEAYDDAWFEGQATAWGTKAASEWDNLT